MSIPSHFYIYKINASALLVGLVLSLSACANAGRLSGGPKDETPPRVVHANSTPNSQTNFTPSEIVLEFDEYVQLDSRNPPFVSPPLQYRLRSETKGYKVYLSFDDREVLRPQTTYSIQLGKHIADLNEKNPLQDYIFAFSTGDKLDTLEINGIVRYGPDFQGLKDATVLLYRSLQDSSFEQGQPAYLAYTDEQGQFRIANLPRDSFHMIGIMDRNGNLRYDQGSESIAFLDTKAFQLQRDTTVTLTAFDELPPLFGSRLEMLYDKYYRLQLNQPADQITLQDSTGIVLASAKKDSLLLWTDRLLDSLVVANGESTDTVYSEAEPDELSSRPLRSDKGGDLIGPPSLGVELMWSNPLSTIDSNAALWLFDSVAWSLDYIVDRDDPRRLKIISSLPTNQSADLILLPGFATDLWGQESLADTLTVRTSRPLEYANLDLMLSQLDSQSHYLLILKDSDGDVFRQDYISKRTEYNWGISRIPVDQYELHIILDSNQNKRWDGGSFTRKRQPEPSRVEKIQSLRPDWDAEILITVGKL